MAGVVVEPVQSEGGMMLLPQANFPFIVARQFTIYVLCSLDTALDILLIC